MHLSSGFGFVLNLVCDCTGLSSQTQNFELIQVNGSKLQKCALRKLFSEQHSAMWYEYSVATSFIRCGGGRSRDFNDGLTRPVNTVYS